MDFLSYQECIKKVDDAVEVYRDYLERIFLEEKASGYIALYRESCMHKDLEEINYLANYSEYHYTLYFYDQAGNLMQTVPPEGVQVFINGGGDYGFKSNYRINSLNQLIGQKTPDGGTTNFFYDSKGRLRLSQNAEQALNSKYSYTRYDKQGRIVEVGLYDP